jgi:outer membrane protein assembly factor BamD
MYQDGLNYFAKERYARSIFFFQKVRDEFPFSPEAENAELKIAEAFYLNKDYAEATEAYKNYLAFQPTSEHAHFIKYQLGLLHYDQFSAVERDQKNIKEAKRYFETLLKDHPESEHVPDAKEKLAKTREYLAEREFYIGQFYLKERKYLAARSRFENVLRDYMDTPTAVKALYMLGDAYRLEKNNVKATLAYEALIERYPDSPYTDQARTYLASLKTEKHDPLASLLMQDGLPTSVGTPETLVADTGSSESGRLQGQDQDLVTKEGYEHEEITNKSLLSSLNPFSSDSEKKDEGAERATEGEQATQESEKGFFSSLNPFSSSSDKAPSDKEPTGQEQTTEDTTDALVSSIDSNLEARGVSGDTITQAPESDLPEVAQEKKAPETDPAELLSELDKGLTREGGTVDIPATPELHEVFATPLPPEPTQEEKLAAVEKAKSTAETSTAGLLDSLDQTLEQKGIQQPDLTLPEEKPPETTPEVAEGGQAQVEPTPSLATTTETIELTPRLNSLGAKDKPLMLKEGEFALGRPEAKATEPAVSETPENGNAATRALPDAVITGVPEKPVPEVQSVSQTKSGASGTDWDKEKNPVEIMADQVDQAAQVLNPLSW